MPRTLKAGTLIENENTLYERFVIQEDSLLISKTERDNYRKKKEAERFNLYVRQNAKEHGGFTFVNTLCDLTVNDPATVGRLAYLSTYLDFNNQALLIGQNYPMRKSDLSHILQITKPTAAKFYGDAVASGLMIDHGAEGLYLDKVFFRGSTNKSDTQTRLYIGTVRNLYNRLKASQHHRFGYVVQLIPFINREWNILCHNPCEVESQSINPMSIKQLCQKLHLNAEHSTRLSKAITTPVFSFDGQEQQLCAIVPTNTNYGKQSTVYVNPHLIYGGSDFSKVEGIGVAFSARVKG